MTDIVNSKKFLDKQYITLDNSYQLLYTVIYCYIPEEVNSIENNYKQFAYGSYL